MLEGEPKTKSNQSLEKALQIIEYMADYQRPIRLQDLSAAVQLPPSTTLRFLNTLKKRRYVSQDAETARYSLTLKLSRLGGKVMAQHSVRNIVRPYLPEIVRYCGESACLAVEERNRVLYIDVESGPDNILKVAQRIGKEAPLYCTGVGKLLLLNRSLTELLDYGRAVKFQQFTPNTITGVDQLMAELNTVREAGYAIDNEECEIGARCIAVPLRGFTGKIEACVSVSGPVTRLTDERIQQYVPILLEISHKISEELGYEATPGESAPTAASNRREAL